ncbi:hypothetical protein IGI82_003707 [Enterococcus sp. AZ067]|uniref:hypothetical protein n=1 Tax=Enterococcus sp. AZ067 TaxID=2774674 RepID=UPI003F1ED50F
MENYRKIIIRVLSYLSLAVLVFSISIYFRSLTSALESQKQRFEVMDQKIDRLEKQLNEEQSDSEIDHEKNIDSGFYEGAVESYLFKDNQIPEGKIFFTENEAKQYGESYAQATNVTKIEITPIEAVLSYSHGEQKDGYVYACLVHTAD